MTGFLVCLPCLFLRKLSMSRELCLGCIALAYSPMSTTFVYVSIGFVCPSLRIVPAQFFLCIYKRGLKKEEREVLTSSSRSLTLKHFYTTEAKKKKNELGTLVILIN